MAAQQESDFRLIQECVQTFRKVTKLGCLLCAPDGNVIYDVGYSVKRCALCSQLNASPDLCIVSRSHAWMEADRFGGKYIYNCPKGLTCIATPVQTDFDTVGYITAGPFLMVETEDYLQCELQPYAAELDQLMRIQDELSQIPNVAPEQAESMAKQLFLSVGGVGKAYSIGDMLEKQNTTQLMGDLSEFTNLVKHSVQNITYPLQLEKEFLHAVSNSEKANAESLLNQLLGHIFFLTGGDFSYIRARICELLVLSTRAAIEGGADETRILTQCQIYIEEMQGIYDVDKLCFWLTGALKQLMALLFDDDAVADRDIMPYALAYIRDHFNERITLDEVAQAVHLSASYFSRLFRSETGQTFSEYLLSVRIERAKNLLRRKDCSMTEIAERIGFFDQSHFIKTFKRATGVTPGLYRRRRGRGYNELELHAKKKI